MCIFFSSNQDSEQTTSTKNTTLTYNFNFIVITRVHLGRLDSPPEYWHLCFLSVCPFLSSLLNVCY